MVRDSLNVIRFLIVTMNKRPYQKKISVNELKVGKNVTRVFHTHFFISFLSEKAIPPLNSF